MKGMAKVELTDTEWIDLLDGSDERAANPEGRRTLGRCCANVSDLRDACAMLVRGPEQAWLFQGAFVRALAFCLADHEGIETVPGIAKLVAAFEMDLELLRSLGHEQIARVDC